jgi:hypothetical protein
MLIWDFKLGQKTGRFQPRFSILKIQEKSADRTASVQKDWPSLAFFEGALWAVSPLNGRGLVEVPCLLYSGFNHSCSLPQNRSVSGRSISN